MTELSTTSTWLRHYRLGDWHKRREGGFTECRRDKGRTGRVLEEDESNGAELKDVFSFFVQSNFLPSTGSQALSITLPEPFLIASCIIVKLSSIVLNIMELVLPNVSAKKEKYY